MQGYRIHYIDAMRGFTMILVVYSHICHFCFGDSFLGYNPVFILFRLPCFFFISGWLFVPAASRPFRAVVGHKLRVLILPTFIFLLLLATPAGFVRELGAMKGGYWFTFVLFEFCVIYMLSARLGRRWEPAVGIVVTVAAYSYSHHYYRLVTGGDVSPLVTDALGFLSVVMWRYYLFFYIGTVVRRHFGRVGRYADSRWVAVGLAVAFIAIALTPHAATPALEFLRFAGGGVTGMLMVFCAFRQLYSCWPAADALWKPLCYVGTRTMDIYMLHYFLLPRFLLPYAPLLRSADSHLLELLVVMLVALVVLSLSLLAGYVLRLSPLLERLLFGTKQQIQNNKLQN